MIFMPMSSDADVIEAVLRGEVDRYAELVDRHQQVAWSVALRLVGNLEDAKELSQNAFVKAYQHLAGFRREAKFSTWLYRIVVNECKDFFKQKARRPPMVAVGVDPEGEETGAVEPVDPSGTPRDLVAERELAGRLQDAVAALPMNQRTAFVLHHVQGLSLEEAADVMGCRVGTVKSHVFRACEQLRGRLEPYLSGGSRHDP